jgi:hypothetical protein
VYPLLVDGIKKDHTRYIGLYKNYQAKVSERVSKIDGANYIARRARGWALCYAGMHILQDALGIDFSNAIELLDKIVYGDIDMAEQKIQTRATDVAGQLSAYVNRHLKHCKINGFWATSEDDMAPEVQALRAKELSRKADDNGVYIIVDQKDAMTEPGRITGRVFISKEATTALKDDLQIHQLAIKAREAGMLYLPESEKARGALLIRVCRGAIQRAYVFDATQTEAPF